MKKTITAIGLVIAILCPLPVGAASIDYHESAKNPALALPADKGAAMQNGCLVIEAEDMSFDKSVMAAYKDPNASGGKGITSTASVWEKVDSNLPAPSFYTTATIEKTDFYAVWIRLRSPKPGVQVSMHYNLNDSSYRRGFFDFDAGDLAGVYRWYLLTSLQLDEGKADLCFKYRSTNIWLDKIIITSNGAFAPVGRDDVPLPKDGVDVEVDFPAPPHTPPVGQHPRVYVTKEEIPKLRKRLKSPVLAKAYAQMLKTVETDYTESIEAKIYNASTCSALQNRAFLYMLGYADAQAAKQTIADLKRYAEIVEFPKQSNYSRLRGYFITTIAVVYDWCYDQLTDDDKRFFIKALKTIAAGMEVGFPPTQKNSIAGHTLEGEIFQHQLGAGIAVYDEDVEIYHLAAGRMFAEMVPAMRYYYDSGSAVSGNAYGMDRFIYQTYADKMMSAIGYPDIFGENFKNAPYKWLYERLPNGNWFKDGDDFLWQANRERFQYKNKDLSPMRYIASEYGNEYFARQMRLHNSVVNYGSTGVWAVLFTDPDADMKEVGDLPLARYTTDPLTSLVARTSWQNGLESKTAMVRMALNNIFTVDHMHANSGSFQLYYKGMLALEGGLYQGLDSQWGGTHFFNYLVRTIASNSMLVFDPDETWVYQGKTYSNDGGQRSAVMAGDYMINSYEKLFSDHARSGVEKAHYIGPNEMTPAFSYLKGDLTNAYTDKVKDYARSMVFMDLYNDDYPAAFVVFDRVESSNAEFKKTFLLQSELEPEIDGDTTVIKRTDHGQNGKLVNKTLSPAASIEKIGGEGKESWVGGVNYINRDPVEDAITDQGRWRVEISPETPRETDIFLNAMYVTDADGNLPELPMHKETGAYFTGVTVRDRLVMFSTNGALVDKTFKLDVRDNGYEKTLCLLGDVAEGGWEIWSPSGSVFAKSVAGENALYLELAPGAYTVAPVSGEITETRFAALPAEKEKLGDFQIRYQDLLMYQPKPAKLIDGLPYVPASTLERMGVKINGITASTDGRTFELTEHKIIDGELYAPILSYQNQLGLTLVYDDYAKLLKVSDGNFLDASKAVVPINVRTSPNSTVAGENAIDGDKDTYWSALGTEEWIIFDLGEAYDIDTVMIAFYLGNQRSTYIDILVSQDGEDYKTVYSGQSGGKTDAFETFAVGAKARYIKFDCHGTNLERILWNSLSEVIFNRK